MKRKTSKFDAQEKGVEIEALEKAPEIDAFLTMLTGRDRKTSIQSRVCNVCGKPATAFKDALSEKEYSISGMCQKCQDEVFQ